MAEGLQIVKELAEDTLTIRLIGDLNVKTSPKLDEELDSSISGVKELILDFTEVEYISSAGLRTLLTTEKNMRSQKGKMILRHVNSAVMEIIRLSGFAQVMTVEN